VKLVVVVVNDPARIEDVLACLIDLEVGGVTVCETTAAIAVLAQEAPLFAGLRELVTAPRSHSRTVFGYTEDADVLDRLERVLREVGYDLAAPGAGFAFLLDLERFVGGVEP